MSEHLAPHEADRIRRAENRWLEQARERLRRPPSTRLGTASQAPSPTDRPQENDR